MPRFTSLVVMIALVPFVPTRIAAQETSADTTGFRAGQWGVQVGASFALANIGILRFTSSRSAWLLRLDVNAEFLSGTHTDLTGASTDVNDRTVYFAAGLGKRFYQAPRHKVRSFQSLGVVGSYVDQKQSFPSGPTYTTTRSAAGLFGELGAGYWVTSNLSLGGTATASAGYSHHSTDNAGDKIRENGWFVSGVNVMLVVGLYF